MDIIDIEKIIIPTRMKSIKNNGILYTKFSNQSFKIIYANGIAKMKDTKIHVTTCEFNRTNMFHKLAPFILKQ